MTQLPPTEPWIDPSGGQGAPQSNGMSMASMVLGIVGMVAWCLPILGLPICIIGLVLGITGKPKGAPGMAVTGIVLSSIGLVLTLANCAWGAYLGATGQHSLFNG